nr:hypothetical protein [Desulfobacula sp.]
LVYDSEGPDPEKYRRTLRTLRIIYYPFILAVAFGFFILALALLTDLLKAVQAGKGGGK